MYQFENDTYMRFLLLFYCKLTVDACMFVCYNKLLYSEDSNPCSVIRAISPEGGAIEMTKYETVFVISTTLEEEVLKATITKFTDLIAANGTIDSVDEWGKRRLAYPINDEPDGYYVLVNFTSEPTFPAELERIYHITEGVLRSMVLSVEE